MTRILFVCHGNICRSPMAEFVFRDMVAKRGMEKDFMVASAATSTEEIGNSPHRGTVAKLRACDIPVGEHRAIQLTRADYDRYDWLVGMDSANLRNMFRILGGDGAEKIRRLLDFSDRPRDIADPWYTGNFDETYGDITEGCEALLGYLLNVQDHFPSKN